MRGLACMILTATICLCGSGCALFGKKTESGTTSSGGFFSKFSKQPAKFPTAPDPIFPNTPPSVPVATPTSATVADNGLLAGRVIDTYNRAPTNTYIRWVNLDESKDGKDAAPIDVAVSPEGYFTIQGLKTGQQYKLIARSKQGEKLLAGITYTQAPNVRVVIQVKEEFSSVATPPAEKTTSLDNVPNAAWATSTPPAALAGGTPPPFANGPRQTAALDLPATVSVPAPAKAVPAANWSATAVHVPPSQPSPWPPTLEIKPKRPEPNLPAAAPQPPPLVQKDAKLNLSPARVPSCVVVGNQLVNLALHDTTGQKWEFQKDRRGRLVLLDFWSTTCVPCRQTMPELQRLSTLYGSTLEVIGIALQEGTLEQQGYAVREVCGRLNVTYRQLLGEPRKSDLRRQFNVEMIPTLVLVNESGVILWRHTGRPDSTTLQELERLVQQRSGSQVF